MKTQRKVVVILLLVATWATAQQTTQSERVARMDQIIQSYVPSNFMGSVLVAQDGKVLLDKGYGFANLELDIPNTPTTKFRLGSLTKQFTAASILLLEERGKLKVEDPVRSTCRMRLPRGTRSPSFTC